MKLKEGIVVRGIAIMENVLGLELSVNGDTNLWFAEIYTDKKGKYIKFNTKYMETVETKINKKVYIKDNLWWAVNRFEEYLKENGCAPTQPK